MTPCLQTRIIWYDFQPLFPKSSLLCKFYSVKVLDLSRFTRFLGGKIWFERFAPCKRFDILQLWELGCVGWEKVKNWVSKGCNWSSHERPTIKGWTVDQPEIETFCVRTNDAVLRIPNLTTQPPCPAYPSPSPIHPPPCMKCQKHPTQTPPTHFHTLISFPLSAQIRFHHTFIHTNITIRSQPENGPPFNSFICAMLIENKLSLNVSSGN